MKRKGKLIHLISHHLPNNHDAVRWADVWLEFTSKPGRRVVHLGPCIVGSEDVKDNAKWDQECGRKVSAETHQALQGNSIMVFKEGPEDMPEIYHPAPLISRKEAEEAITFWLRSRLNYELFRFRWKRSPFSTTPF